MKSYFLNIYYKENENFTNLYSINIDVGNNCLYHSEHLFLNNIHKEIENKEFDFIVLGLNILKKDAIIKIEMIERFDKNE